MYSQFKQPKIPKLTKSIAEQYIAMNLRVNINQLNFIKLTEQPKDWKHSCVPTGVIVLQPYRLTYDTSVIEVAVCKACRKVIYYYEDVYGSY